MLDTINNPIVGFYDTGEEELPDYQPDFKKLRQDNLDGKMRDDLEQVIGVSNMCINCNYIHEHCSLMSFLIFNPQLHWFCTLYPISLAFISVLSKSSLLDSSSIRA